MMKENNNKKFNKRPKNIVLELPIVLGVSMSGEDYSDESALEALDHLQKEILPYINVPVKAARSLLVEDEEKKKITKGFVDIGYIISYDASNEVIKAGFYNKYADFVENNDLALKLNVIAKDNILTKITTFEVVTRNSGM